MKQSLEKATEASEKGYFDHPAEKPGYDGVDLSNIYRRFRIELRRATSIVFDETTTIGSFLKDLKKIESKPWIPDLSISDYEKKMRDSYELLIDFMIDYFKKAYPEHFNIDNIIEKYKLSE